MAKAAQSRFHGGNLSNACETAVENVPTHHQTPALGAYRGVPWLLSQLLGVNRPSQLRSVIRSTRVFGSELGADSSFRLPPALSVGGCEAMAYPRQQVETVASPFEFRIRADRSSGGPPQPSSDPDHFVLEPDGTAIEGILFVGEVSPN